MYINKIAIENFGPLQRIVIDCPFDEHQNPLPLILVGTNGSGKTSILANIIDALVELKRKKYQKLQEVEEQNYLKVGKKNYITSGKKYSYVNIKVTYADNSASYVDFARVISQEAFNDQFDKNNFENINWQDQKLVAEGYFKTVNANNDFLETFENEVLLYFPFSRYEVPAWWHPDHELGFHLKEKYIGVSDRNFIKNNVVEEVEEWLLNVSLDAEIYEKQLISLGQFLGQGVQAPENLNQLKIFTGYSGKNTSLKNTINELLTILYKAKDPTIESVRLGISDKSYRTISVIEKREGLPEAQIAPTISHLSSGELMIFSLFCSILKEYDQLNKGNNITLGEISGTVVIDEIDLHLHIDLQKILLPKLIKKFPKIQFVITSHSPLFLIGIEESFQDIKAVNLPEGNLIPLSEFSEVEQAFDVFVEKFSSFKESYQVAYNAIRNLTKPLIITEGKTDWKHLKKALERFKEIEEFDTLDFDFLEYEDEVNMGDSELFSLCEQFKKTPQSRKIICIFDRDNPNITSKISDPYVDFGNNVYAFCIAKPAHRDGYNNVSIEFFYTDKEIQTEDENGKRLLFSNEVEKRMTQPMTRQSPEIKFIKLDAPLDEDEHDKKIYDQDVDKVVDSERNSVGLSKSVFAQYVLESKEEFSNFDIEPFRAIFEIIAEIIE
jgi:predicted ATP-binding protein involved in virulence